MKKLYLFSIFAFSLLFLNFDNAYALNCKSGNSQNSDECWTEVKIAPGYTTLVSRGHLLVVSYLNTAVDNIDGWVARHPSSSNDIALGVAQSAIATGQEAQVLARGKGVINLINTNRGTVTSGDTLGINASSTNGSVVESTAASHQRVIAHSFETTTTDDADLQAYITIV